MVKRPIDTRLANLGLRNGSETVIVKRRDGAVHRRLQELYNIGKVGDLTDGQLLERFAIDSDELAELSFAALVERHQTMVWRVCLAILRDEHLTEDAVQATFLVLVRKGRSLWVRDSIGPWLHQVACRTASCLRASVIRWRRLELRLGERAAVRKAQVGTERYLDQDADVHEEVHRLPEKYRAPVVLCDLEGRTHAEAARSLGWPIGTVKSRQSQGRGLLRDRLVRRGLGLAGAGAVCESMTKAGVAAIPREVAESTVKAAMGLTARGLPGRGASANVLTLTHQVLHAMLLTRLRLIAVAAISIAIACGGTIAYVRGSQESATKHAEAAVKLSPKAPAPDPQRKIQDKIDRYGDPLPRGAVLRLGTLRYRQNQEFERLAYSPDGEFVVTNDGSLGLQVWDSREGRKIRTLDFMMDPFQDFAFSPDGRVVAIAGWAHDERGASISHLIFAELATGRQISRIERLQHFGTIKIAFAPDGKTLVTANDALRFWDVASGKMLFEASMRGERAHGIAFSRDAASHLLAVGGRSVHLWDVTDHHEVRQFIEPERIPDAILALSRDGKMLAAPAGFHGAVRLWSFPDGRPLQRLSGANDIVQALSFSPDGKFLAATGHEGILTVWDLRTGKASEPFPTEGLADGPLAFSPDGNTIATSGSGKVLHFWDRTTGRDRLATPEAHLGSVQALLIADAGKSLISASDDHTVRIWDITGNPGRAHRQRAVLKHGGWVRTMALSPNEHWLVTGSTYPGTDKEPVFLWHLPTRKLRRTFPSPGEGLSPIGVRVSDDGGSIMVCWSDGTLKSWETTTMRELAVTQPRLQGVRPASPGSFAHSATFSSDGRRLAILEHPPGAVRVAELAGGKELFAIPMGDRVAFSPDGLTIAVAEPPRQKDFRLGPGRIRDEVLPDSVVYIVDGATGGRRRRIVVPGAAYVASIAFSADGKVLAVVPGSNEPKIRLYNVADGRRIATIAIPPTAHTSLGLAFTRDGKRLVVGMSDTSILIWDVPATN